ncbi:PAS domain-containing hybrid sensor histidine kinase/response regulator [Phyllobacterium leguminum]|uniref:histidine kinase n=1 Tax=Phyllobacterium leguminum TaxID=314237 RepID=A0A318T7A7_9HYPH|nr:PAS domain-containing hybrid sensor histidine kinase/response regulator [Phyllobacterium leguminum]PYE86384.1 Na+/proline symporter [Phyllobacterium leguminum]
MQGWGIIGIAFLYLLLLFGVASMGDRRAQRWGTEPRPYIYALSLAVYCTSWTFFGSVGVAAERGLEFLGIYIGPILVFTLGNKLVRHIVRLAKAERITSIADFLAARYGKSFAVASIATIIATIGALPYIALQLKAVSGSVDLIVAHYGQSFDPIGYIFSDVSLPVACVLALFAILFGTRHTDATEHQDGLILAVALESVIKLCAFLAVGFVCTFYLFGNFSILMETVTRNEAASHALNYRTSTGTWLVQTVLSAIAILMLPRQFHVAVVENRSERELGTAAWLFPAYLVLINLFVLPIALAGVVTLGPNTNADLYVLALPLAADSHLLALIAFVGGLSAATAMVIVACVALSVMISNHLLLPLFIKHFIQNQDAEPQDLTRVILYTRRATIIGILFISFIYYRETADNIRLSSIGLISFAAIAQFAPAFLGGLIWRGANARGAVAGMASGFAVWAYTLLLPTLAPPGAAILREGLLGIAALRPQALFGTDAFPLTNGVIWSLAINTAFYVLGSLSRKATPLERIQATAFMPREIMTVPTLRRFRTTVTVDELKATIARYLGAERMERSFRSFELRENRKLVGSAPADMATIRYAERLLGSAVGSSSSRLVLSLLLQRNDSSTRGALRLLDDASEALQQNRGLLQIALDQMEQGITVFDKDFRLTCWNRRFRLLADLPDEFGQVGIPFSEIIDYLSRRGDVPIGNIANIMRNFTTFRQPWRIELKSSGRILEIRSNPMPDGGIVATYTDITIAVEAANALKKINETLEQRVTERTVELTHVNSELAKARAVAEEANLGKTRFLAAVGHDILQPLNAARLYSSALTERLQASDEGNLTRNIDSSLESVEAILGAVLDISRLDTGALKPHVSIFRLDELMKQIATDFAPLARQKGLRLRVVPSSVAVETDRNLLRRLVQNLVSNAIKYSRSGSVLLGARRRGRALELQVLDSGIGIPADKLEIVFREFTRLDEGAREAEGLGLGLSIVDRIARVLALPLDLTSVPGRGTVFSVKLSPAQHPMPAEGPQEQSLPYRTNELKGTSVLVIDNDERILSGMKLLLTGWGCRVAAVRGSAELEALYLEGAFAPDIVLADYHLNDESGLDLIGQVWKHFGRKLPAVLITADRSNEVRLLADVEGVTVLHKPLKPAALRALLSHYHGQRQAAE